MFLKTLKIGDLDLCVLVEKSKITMKLSQKKFDKCLHETYLLREISVVWV